MTWLGELLGQDGRRLGFVTAWDSKAGEGEVRDDSGRSWLMLERDVPGEARCLATGTGVWFDELRAQRADGFGITTNVEVIASEKLLQVCAECAVAPGQAHEEDCDHASCPECGEQLLLHDEHRQTRPALWSGIDPREQMARELGWWTVRAEAGLVEDFDSVTEARVRGYVEWDPVQQRYRKGRISGETVPVLPLVEALLVWAGTAGGVPAAIKLLHTHWEWLGKRVFRAFVWYTEDSEETAVPVAAIDWQAALQAEAADELGGTESDRAVLRVAASLAAGHLIDLQRVARVAGPRDRALIGEALMEE